MADNFQLEANQLLQWRAEGKVSFPGTIFRPDGIIDMEELMAAREKWRVTRTVRTHGGRVIELPQQLLEWECNSGSLRAFYAQYPEAVDTVIYCPGERFKEALARQPDDVKRVRTLIIQRRMIQHITMREWHLLHGDIDQILAIDPLNRLPGIPSPEDWAIPEGKFLSDNEDGAAGSSATAPFQPFDPDFDWGTLRRSPDFSIKVEIKKKSEA